jgi:hypothetical protein
MRSVLNGFTRPDKDDDESFRLPNPVKMQTLINLKYDRA